MASPSAKPLDDEEKIESAVKSPENGADAAKDRSPRRSPSPRDGKKRMRSSSRSPRRRERRPSRSQSGGRNRRRSKSRSRSKGRCDRRDDRGGRGGRRSRSRSREAKRGRGGRSRSRSGSRSPSRHSDSGSVHSTDSREEDESLPVFFFKDELIKAITEHRVLVCKGETGSGKTTQLPQYLCDAFKPQGLVGVTQPRRVAAVSVATRVAQERRGRIGDEVGYQIRFEDKTSRNTRIKFMTDGCLVRECLHDPVLRRYSFIMLDEAHERSVNTDILFGLMKRALQQRPDLKVIITSATLDVARFSKYFDDCPIVEVPVRTHPVTIYHSKTKFIMTPTGPANQSYIQATVDTALKIHRSQEEGHILAFLTGQDEIEKACTLINKAMEEEQAKLPPGQHPPGGKLLVQPLYGMLTSDQQVKVFDEMGHGVRKCIVATNIAETSLTVPGVRYVIDPGFVKQKTYNPEKRMESLVVVPISQVAAEQRAGRAGRTGPGQCFRLYSKDSLLDMMPETVPEIRRCNLSNVVLYLKVLGIDDVIGFEYFEAPSQEQLQEALLLLHSLGALDDDGKVTAMGETMSKLSLDPCLSRAILEAVELKCIKEVLTVCAMLSAESIWYSRRRDKGEVDEEAERAHAVFRHPRGDHITYLMIYAAWEEQRFSEGWCRTSFLSMRALKNARNIRRQLEQEVRRAVPVLGKDGPMTSARDMDSICKAITAGFFNNAGSRCGNDRVYKHLPGLMPHDDMKLVYIHPTSALASLSPPQCVLYHELVLSSKPFMRHVLGVDRPWLMECRRRIGRASISQLSGGAITADEAALNPLEEHILAGGTQRDGARKREEEEKEQKPVTQEGVDAARKRFLDRKNAKKDQGAKGRRSR